MPMKRITETAKAVGVSPTTLRRWVRRGLVPVWRSPAGRWFWTDVMIQTIGRTKDDPQVGGRRVTVPR
jgi:predicted site-specific integrase-resolvase